MTIDILEHPDPGDISDLCQATAVAIRAGAGFGWLEPPERPKLEAYWRSMIADPLRTVFAARADGQVCGSVQLARPSPSAEAIANQAMVKTLFVAPAVRGMGHGRRLMMALERAARAEGLHYLNLDVRATKVEAIKLYESLGFRRWGTNPSYVDLPGLSVAGHYYSKRLRG